METNRKLLIRLTKLLLNLEEFSNRTWDDAVNTARDFVTRAQNDYANGKTNEGELRRRCALACGLVDASVRFCDKANEILAKGGWESRVPSSTHWERDRDFFKYKEFDKATPKQEDAIYGHTRGRQRKGSHTSENCRSGK